MKYWTTKSGIEIYRVLRERSNCYAVSDGNRFLLIDTGRKKNWSKLESGLNRLRVKEGSSISLVLTHCHFDHAENAARIKKTYKASIIVHKSEGDYLKSGENPNIAGTVLLTKILSGILSRTKLLYRLGYEPVDYNVLMDEKFGLEPFGFPGYLLLTPGHTEGSISAIIDDEIAIVGDAMFGVFAGSVFPPFADDVGLMVESWKKLLDTGCRIYLPAHGSERSEDLLKRQYEKYKNLYDR